MARIGKEQLQRTFENCCRAHGVRHAKTAADVGAWVLESDAGRWRVSEIKEPNTTSAITEYSKPAELYDQLRVAMQLIRASGRAAG